MAFDRLCLYPVIDSQLNICIYLKDNVSVTVINYLAPCLRAPEFDCMYCVCVCVFLHYSKAVKQIIEQEPGSLIFDVNNWELF